jgi:hypothetical protein
MRNSMRPDVTALGLFCLFALILAGLIAVGIV